MVLALNPQLEMVEIVVKVNIIISYNEPGHSNMYNVTRPPGDDIDQRTHPISLISIFTVSIKNHGDNGGT